MSNLIHLSFYDWLRQRIPDLGNLSDSQLQFKLERSANRDIHRQFIKRYDDYVDKCVKELNDHS